MKTKTTYPSWIREIVEPGQTPDDVTLLRLTVEVTLASMRQTGGGPFGATDTLATVIYRETFAYGQFGYGAALALMMFVLVLGAAIMQLWATRARD